jgi:hypothetical protein
MGVHVKGSALTIPAYVKAQPTTSLMSALM